ncbi:PREDICTED: ABC transporter C family member 5-like [Lupinus angustifolius]|uniref:ABC transporter C family member 5-like n=1 Tax=Lupinus angustifolius TaxID=3871 RepID=UPI00092ED868|nr:PREDICTED: ABC transporter C family member 5-like [Lupinus angustifolius]
MTPLRSETSFFMALFTNPLSWLALLPSSSCTLVPSLCVSSSLCSWLGFPLLLPRIVHVGLDSSISAIEQHLWSLPSSGGVIRVAPRLSPGCSSWFIFVRAVLVAAFGLAASHKLFFKMLGSIFHAPMSFFDSTPAGRILNRVSFDQSVVDLDITFRLGGFASIIQLIGIVAVMLEVTWQVLLLVVPMAVACLWMQVIKHLHAFSKKAC